MSDRLVEHMLEKRRIHEGRMISLRVDRVRLPNGQETTREIVEHPGAVAVVPVTENGEILLVKQYRYAIDRVTLELPAGKLDAGEDPDSAAMRELSEETGYTTTGIRHLLTFYSTPGFSNEVMHLYLANELTAGEQHLDEDEFVDCISVTRPDVVRMIQSGEIVDAKTLVGLYWWLNQS